MENSYDNEIIFKSFLDERKNKNSPYNLQVKPKMFNLIGDVKGKRILDIGCGVGDFVKELSLLGAKYVYGIDISQKEIDYAKKENQLSNNSFDILDANNLLQIKEKFDIVCSSITFDYIENFEILLSNIYKLLKKSGIIVYSQVHPFSTAPLTKRQWLSDKESKYIYQLSDYSNNGERIMSYFNGEVKMYHRTFSYLIKTIIKYGFKILDIIEPIPDKNELLQFPDREKNLHKPSFLIFKLMKN